MALEPVWKSIIANCTPKLWRTSYRKLFSKHALGDKLVIPDIIKWYECQKVFWHSFDIRIATQLRCSRNPPNIRNPLIYCVNRYFLIFGVSQVQTPYRASTNGFLTFWHWYHNIALHKNQSIVFRKSATILWFILYIFSNTQKKELPSWQFLFYTYSVFSSRRLLWTYASEPS